METKLRWLSEVNKGFKLDRSLVEVKIFAVTSRFMYISKSRTAVIDSMTDERGISVLVS